MGYRWYMGPRVAFVMEEINHAKQMSNIDTNKDYDWATYSTAPRAAPMIDGNASNISTVLGYITPTQSPSLLTTSTAQELCNDLSCDAEELPHIGPDVLAVPGHALLDRFWREVNDNEDDEDAIFEEDDDAKATSILPNAATMSSSSHATMSDSGHRAGSRGQSRTRSGVLTNNNKLLDTATAKPPTHIRTPSNTVDILAEYRSYCHRYSVPIRSDGMDDPATPKVPSPLRNELKSDGNAKHKAYKKKAKLNFTRYKFKKRRAVHSGSTSFSDSDSDISASTEPYGLIVQKSSMRDSSPRGPFSSHSYKSKLSDLVTKGLDCSLTGPSSSHSYKSKISDLATKRHDFSGSDCSGGCSPTNDCTKGHDCSGNDCSGDCSGGDCSETPTSDPIGYLKTAFQIIQRCADQVGPQLMAYTSSLEERRDEFSLMVEPLTNDEMEAFASMGLEERLIFIAQWLVKREGLSKDENSLMGDKPGNLSHDLNNLDPLEAAFVVLRRFADQFESLWAEYTSLCAEQCEEYILAYAHLNADEVGEYMAMSMAERLSFYQQWCADHDDLARDERMLNNTSKCSQFLHYQDKHSAVSKLAHAARCRSFTYPNRSSEMRNPETPLHYGMSTDIGHNRSALLDYWKIRINPKPSKVRAFRRNKKDRDYFGKNSPELLPTVSQLDLSLDLIDSESQLNQSESLTNVQRPNPPYTKVLRILSNLCLTTVLETWIQTEVDEETYFETYPWHSQPYTDFITGWHDSITFYELRYIEDRQREREVDRTKNLDKMADLYLCDHYTNELNPSTRVKASRRRHAFSFSESPPKDHRLDKLCGEKLPKGSPMKRGSEVLVEAPQVSTRLMIPSGYGLPKVPPRVEIPQPPTRSPPMVLSCVEPHVSTRSDSVSTIALGIPPGYGPPIVPPRKPLAQCVQIAESVEDDSMPVRDTPPNTPPGKSCEAVIRAKERCTSEISKLKLPAPELSDSRFCGPLFVPHTPPVTLDIPVEVKNDDTTVKPRKVSFAEVKYRPSIDDPTPTVGPKYDEDSGYHSKDFGKALDSLEPADGKKSLPRRISSRIKKATSRREIKTVFGRRPSWGSSWRLKGKASTEMDLKSASGSLDKGSGRSLKERASIDGDERSFGRWLNPITSLRSKDRVGNRNVSGVSAFPQP